MFALVVRFDLRNDAAAAQFDGLTRRLVEQIAANEPGTVLYSTHGIVGEPLARLFYEVYADEGAFRAHGQTEHVKAFMKAREALLSARRVEHLTRIADKGLPLP